MRPIERVEELEKKASEYGWDIYGPGEVTWLLRVARAAVEWNDARCDVLNSGKPVDSLLARDTLIAAVEDKP